MYTRTIYGLNIRTSHNSRRVVAQCNHCYGPRDTEQPAGSSRETGHSAISSSCCPPAGFHRFRIPRNYYFVVDHRPWPVIVERSNSVNYLYERVSGADDGQPYSWAALFRLSECRFPIWCHPRHDVRTVIPTVQVPRRFSFAAASAGSCTRCPVSDKMANRCC